MTGATPLPRMRLQGIGAWAAGMPDWAHLRRVARSEAEPMADAPRRPTSELLPANERRRAPDVVLLALQVAQAACVAADADPRALPSVFTSMHGDLGITDFMGRTLASAPQEISPTKFHNSVHNAAAGYWTIGVGCRAAASAISAYQASFAQGLLEAAMQIHAGAPQVLLVAFDGPSVGPLDAVSHSRGLLGVALVLANETWGATIGKVGLHQFQSPVPVPEERKLAGASSGPMLHADLCARSAAPAARGPLFAHLGDNAMAPALVLCEALATDATGVELDAGPDLCLRIRFA